MYSPLNWYMAHGHGDKVNKWRPRMCGFAKDTGNQDSGSALLKYSTGMHAVYTQNFVARRSAASRGARLIGYDGTIEFDWYTNKATVHMHHEERTEVHDCTPSAGHFGGDLILAWNFIKVLRGESESISPFQAGIDSALLCLKARESCLTNTFQDVRWHVA